MKPLTLLIALLPILSPRASAAPKTPAPEQSSPFSGADQKLLDRYLAALGDKFGLAPWALKDGALTARGGKDIVDVREARSEEEIEARIFKTLAASLPRSEAGDAKTPVYFAGATEDDLFKGAVRKDGVADAEAKAAGNEWKALLDLTSAQISVPGQHQAPLEFKVDAKAPRRVVLRRGDDGSLDAFLEGDGYAYAAGRVRAGGKTERDPVKSGTASVFFEMNAWMQKTLAAADKRRATANPLGRTDGGYRHPSFEALMNQVRAGLTTDNLDKTFDNAGAKAPADLQARAQAAQALIDSGYGGAARWKINSNGKYADKDGNLTLMVRIKDGPGGKIEETPVLIKKDAKGHYDLAAAVGPVTQLLLNGDTVGAKAAAMKAAFTASPAAVAAEVKSDMLVGPAALGFDVSRFDGPAKAPVDLALKAALERRAAALRRAEAVKDPCEGRTGCTVPALAVQPVKQDPLNEIQPGNVACFAAVDHDPNLAMFVAAGIAPPAMASFAGTYEITAAGTRAVAVGCGKDLPTARAEADRRLGATASCSFTPSNNVVRSEPRTFPGPNGTSLTCLEEKMTPPKS